jgi:hypothetical protein
VSFDPADAADLAIRKAIPMKIENELDHLARRRGHSRSPFTEDHRLRIPRGR